MAGIDRGIPLVEQACHEEALIDSHSTQVRAIAHAVHLERLALMKAEGITHEKPHIRLVRDIHEVWPAGADYLTTEAMLTELRRKSPMDWNSTGEGRSPLNAQRLGRMLVTNFGVFSDRQERLGQRGYYRGPFRTAWESLGLETGSRGITIGTPVGGTPASSEITSGGSEAAVEDGRFDVKDHLTPLSIKPAQPARAGATGAPVSA